MMTIKKSKRQAGPSSNFDRFGDPIPPAWITIYTVKGREISEWDALLLVRDGKATIK